MDVVGLDGCFCVVVFKVVAFDACDVVVVREDVVVAVREVELVE